MCIALFVSKKVVLLTDMSSPFLGANSYLIHVVQKQTAAERHTFFVVRDSFSLKESCRDYITGASAHSWKYKAPASWIDVKCSSLLSTKWERNSSMCKGRGLCPKYSHNASKRCILAQWDINALSTFTFFTIPRYTSSPKTTGGHYMSAASRSKTLSRCLMFL
jgi:hypothetical protein